MPSPQDQGSRFLLRFPSLYQHRKSMSFPCDARGEVALNALSERERNNYFFARTCVGRDFSLPRIEPVLH